MGDEAIAKEVRDLMEEIAKDFDETQIKTGEVTWRMFADYKHIDGDCAKNFLENMVKDGKLTRRFVVYDGKKTMAYSKPSLQEHCGHDLKYIISSDEGTNYCSECERLARKKNSKLV